MDYTITVKGSGRKEGDGAGSPTIIWSIDRSYSGGAELDVKSINLTTEEAQDWKIQAEAFKTQHKLKFTQKDIKSTRIAVQINDKVEVITDEECADNSDETTTDISIWKVDTSTRNNFPIELTTDSALSTYNVSIPLYLAGATGWANMPMASQTKYTRTFNVKPSKASTGITENEARIPALPSVKDLIYTKLFVGHGSARSLPPDLFTKIDYDSGNLQPESVDRRRA